MGYFNGVASAYFKKGADGKAVFYPWGVIAKGYVLPDEAAEAKTRRFIKIHLIVSLPAMVIAVNYSLTWVCIAAAASFAWFYFQVKALLKGCPVSAERLTFKESYTNSAKAHNKAGLWALFIISLLFVAAGIWFMIVGPAHSSKVALALSTLFFGACSCAIGYMVKVRMK